MLTLEKAAYTAASAIYLTNMSIRFHWEVNDDVQISEEHQDGYLPNGWNIEGCLHVTVSQKNLSPLMSHHLVSDIFFKVFLDGYVDTDATVLEPFRFDLVLNVWDSRYYHVRKCKALLQGEVTRMDNMPRMIPPCRLGLRSCRRNAGSFCVFLEFTAIIDFTSNTIKRVRKKALLEQNRCPRKTHELHR